MGGVMANRGTILVVGNDPTVHEVVSDFLKSARYAVHLVQGSDGILPALKERHFDAVVLDSMLNNGMGIDLLPVIKGFDPSLEVIIITEVSAGDTAMNAISLGASSYLQRPVRMPALLNRVRTAITTRSFSQYIYHLLDTSQPKGPQVRRRIESMERLLRFDKELMSIMDYRRVLDAILNGILSMTGADVAAALLIRDKVSSAMVLSKPGVQHPSREALLQSLMKDWESWGGHVLNTESLLWSGLDEGMTGKVSDAVVAPLMVQDSLIGALGAFTTDSATLAPEAAALVPIVAGRAEIVVENAFLHEHTKILATTDSLTGLLNRRVFREGIMREFERSRRIRLNKRTGGELSMIMLDVDHFKNFNDTYGHQMGDKVLKMVATVMMSIARRATDMVARYGGEEFVIIAPDTSLENARLVAERIRQLLNETHVESSSGPLYVTASFGVSTYPTCGATTVEMLIEQCDESLYRAKRNGRNRVEAAPTIAEPDEIIVVQSS